MKFAISIHIHIHKFSVDIHGYIHGYPWIYPYPPTPIVRTYTSKFLRNTAVPESPFPLQAFFVQLLKINKSKKNETHLH